MTAKEAFELLNSTMQNEAEDYVFDNIIKPVVIARLDKEFEDYDWEVDVTNLLMYSFCTVWKTNTQW